MGRITIKGGRKMIACKTYDEARLAIINVLSNFDNYVSHLHIIKVDGTYYADYEEDYTYANDEEESEAE